MRDEDIAASIKYGGVGQTHNWCSLTHVVLTGGGEGHMCLLEEGEDTCGPYWRRGRRTHVVLTGGGGEGQPQRRCEIYVYTKEIENMS